MTCLFWLNDEVEGGETVLWLHCMWLRCSRPSIRLRPHIKDTSCTEFNHVNLKSPTCKDMNIIQPTACFSTIYQYENRIAKPPPTLVRMLGGSGFCFCTPLNCLVPPKNTTVSLTLGQDHPGCQCS